MREREREIERETDRERKREKESWAVRHQETIQQRAKKNMRLRKNDSEREGKIVIDR